MRDRRLIFALALFACAGQTSIPPTSLSVTTTFPAAAVPISRTSAKYKVEANVPYAPHAWTVLDMIYPVGGGPDAKPDAPPLPGVIMFHGGGWIRTDKSTMSSFYNRFLDHGFIVCNVEYRLADGTDHGATAPAAVEDALASAKWFWDHAEHYHVDKKRIVVTGASAGGHLALMVGMCNANAKLGPTSPADFKIAAIVNGYGPPDVPDLLTRGTSWARQWLPENTPDRMQLAARVSPLSYVRKDLPPLLTVQGSRDTTVPVEQNQRLAQAFKDLGADAELHLVEGAGHGFTTPPTAWPDAEHEIFDVFLPAHGIIKAPASEKP